MAYLRFLTNKDYDAVATKEHMHQVLRDIPDRIIQAEQRAEMQLLEYLDQYYEIEKVLAVGKNIRPYNHFVCYPSHIHIIHNHEIFKTLTAVNGLKRPTAKIYWKHLVDFIDPCLLDHAQKYSQLKTYAKGDVVRFGTEYWQCEIPHGYEAGEIHLPSGEPWKEVQVTEWEPNMEWQLNQVCSYEGNFYQYLYDITNSPGTTPDESFDEGMNMPDGDGKEVDSAPKSDDGILPPDTDDKWGLIGEYSEELEYDYSEDSHDYVVAEDKVFVAIMNPNADKLEVGENIVREDPRNANVVSQMVRLSYYHLNSIIAPTHVPETVRWGYEDVMMWLHNASKFKINPQLPRKHERDSHMPKVDWACETFARDYNPNENPWLI